MALNLLDWVYKTEIPYVYRLPEKFAVQITATQVFRGVEDGKPLLTLSSMGSITCHPGIYTDGASPKFRLGPFILGTWDGIEIDGYPQCLGVFTKHDLLGKFAGAHPFGYIMRHRIMLWAMWESIPPAIAWLRKQPLSWRFFYRLPLILIWYGLGPLYFIGVALANPIYELFTNGRSSALSIE